MADWLLLAGALVAGIAAGAVLTLALERRRARRGGPAEPVLTEVAEVAAPRPVVELAPVATAAAPQAPAPPAGGSVVVSEWARRDDGGALAPGRTKGVCSGCGVPITVSTRRPLRISCPECGRSRLLA